MGIRSFFSKPIAKYFVEKVKRKSSQPVETQKAVFDYLIAQGRKTQFGKDHQFDTIKSYQDFKDHVPVTDYEDLIPYIEKVKLGVPDVLWPGKPMYLAKTSGTTSGTKYIPISKESIPYHISAARDALLHYVYETGNSKFFDRQLIFLSGSPILEKVHGLSVGRLSGIVNHHVPAILKTNQSPTYETNCMEDWEAKVDQIVAETYQKDMSLISGIPPWVQMYFDKLQAKTGKKIKDIFPNFSLFVYGGVNFEPYKSKLYESIGKQLDSIETYPASEGFIAYQDKQNEPGLLLLIDGGIFYEFIPSEDYFKADRKRLQLEEVELGVNYALILNTNAGLWGYSIGDTIKFIQKNPYKLIVTGRIKHFISAFGEHVIGEEVEKALQYAQSRAEQVEVIEFTVAPEVVDPEGGLPYHEWFISFGKAPENMQQFALDLDLKLQELNSYYKDLITGNILQQLKLTVLKPDAFIEYMRQEGKLGGQNKVPRLSNDRKIADALQKFKL